MDGYQYTNPRLPRVSTRIHIELIVTIRDRDREKLNLWEENFLESIVHFDHPTQKQIDTVKMIVAKALTKGSPRLTRRRRAVMK